MVDRNNVKSKSNRALSANIAKVQGDTMPVSCSNKPRTQSTDLLSAWASVLAFEPPIYWRPSLLKI